MDMQEENKPGYYSVTPATVRYNKKIVHGAKLLYGEITALSNKEGFCWATNEYFADLYDNTKVTISRWIASLAKEGYIYVSMQKGKRKIFLTDHIDIREIVKDKDLPAKEKSAKPKKEKEKPKKKVPVKYTKTDSFLAELLLQKVIYNFPTFENKKVNISDWAEDIRKLREIDKATHEQINFMINWIHGGEIRVEGKPLRVFKQHDFWSKNILSAGKLRKQWFENLVPQLQDAVKKDVKKNTVTQL